MHWYLEVLKKAFDFSGRARRKEYWMFALFNILISMVLSFVDVTILSGNEDKPLILNLIYNLFIFIPSIAVTVRRLHDTDHSGWSIFLVLIPIVGAIVLLLFLVREGQHGPNRFGYNPKATKKSFAGASGLDDF